MPRKKESYASLTRKIDALLERQKQERQRMATIIADVLLTDCIAAQIGDYTDAELRKMMGLLSEYLYDCIDRVENDRKNRYTAADRTKHSVNVSESVADSTYQTTDTAVVQ